MDDAMLHWALGQVRANALHAASGADGYGGIGTLGERTLHATMKYCFEPDPRFHEIPVEGFVTDIARPSGMVEIQTGSLYPLARKLPVLLRHGPVTVVHPLSVEKWVRWVDPATGEVTPPRRSPRPDRPSDALPELFWVRGLLAEPGLRICLVRLAVEDYRLKNGRGPDGKKGGARYERIPTAYLGQLTLCGPQDCAALLPEGLPPVFTAAEFAAASRLRGRRCSAALKLLNDCGILAHTGEKRGRAQLWQCLPAEASVGGAPNA